MKAVETLETLELNELSIHSSHWPKTISTCISDICLQKYATQT